MTFKMKNKGMRDLCGNAAIAIKGTFENKGFSKFEQSNYKKNPCVLCENLCAFAVNKKPAQIP